MDKKLEKIIRTVQHNCHIADARHAGDYTLCVYLLKMREMYRWEQGIDFKTQLTTDDVGDWLTEREGLWDDIEEQEYLSLEINHQNFKPFDNHLIKPLLDDYGLVYNAGLGLRCRPHFFIADLIDTIKHDDYTVYISGKEYARDMAAPPAMAQGDKIFIRKESLRRVIWETLDDARVTGLDNPLTRAMSFYDFERDAEMAINQMTDIEINYVIQHEIGEVRAGHILGEKWNEAVINVTNTPAEIMLRAIRDHLADSLATLPKLLQNQGSEASLHFYFGNMNAMRKMLAPSLVSAYQTWYETGSTRKLKETIVKSQYHWQNLAVEVIKLSHPNSNNTQAKNIEAYIKEQIL